MIIPTFAVSDVGRSAAFYTEVLDFQLAHLMTPAQSFYAVLTRGDDELHLSLATRREPGGQSATVVCQDLDRLFASFRRRGLKPSDKLDSPVHQGPLDQTWGTREVYIDDPDGNTLCFQQR